MENEQGKAQKSFEHVRQGDWYVHGHEASPEESAAEYQRQQNLSPAEKAREDLVVNKGPAALPAI